MGAVGKNPGSHQKSGTRGLLCRSCEWSAQGRKSGRGGAGNLRVIIVGLTGVSLRSVDLVPVVPVAVASRGCSLVWSARGCRRLDREWLGVACERVIVAVRTETQSDVCVCCYPLLLPVRSGPANSVSNWGPGVGDLGYAPGGWEATRGLWMVWAAPVGTGLSRADLMVMFSLQPLVCARLFKTGGGVAPARVC